MSKCTYKYKIYMYSIGQKYMQVNSLKSTLNPQNFQESRIQGSRIKVWESWTEKLKKLFEDLQL